MKVNDIIKYKGEDVKVTVLGKVLAEIKIVATGRFLYVKIKDLKK